MRGRCAIGVPMSRQACFAKKMSRPGTTRSTGVLCGPGAQASRAGMAGSGPYGWRRERRGWSRGLGIVATQMGSVATHQSDGNASARKRRQELSSGKRAAGGGAWQRVAVPDDGAGGGAARLVNVVVIVGARDGGGDRLVVASVNCERKISRMEKWRSGRRDRANAECRVRSAEFRPESRQQFSEKYFLRMGGTRRDFDAHGCALVPDVFLDPKQILNSMPYKCIGGAKWVAVTRAPAVKEF